MTKPDLVCITFDLDDTLWPVGPVIRHAEARFYAWVQIHAPEVSAQFSAEALIAQRIQFMRAAPADERYDLTRLRKRWLAQIAAETGACAQTLTGPGFDVFWEARNEVDPYPEAVPVLGLLSQHFRLGAITNGNADVFRTPLGEFFEFAVPAAEAGAAKPSPLIFGVAAARAQTPPAAILHIGDDPIGDVVGARSAGMRAAWFNPNRLPWPEPDTRPEFTVGRLGQIPIQLGLVESPPLRP